MKLDVANETAKARRIGNYEDTLQSIKNSLEGFKTNVNSGWKAEEMRYFNSAIDQVTSRLAKIAPQLSSIESDIISTAKAIRREEDEKEAAEKAAREAAAANQAK
ncbi:hypothetical protein [Neobacillus muris]|uniref:hypothetical protein n=1 Tax=Neobacillus muris TaxID=2941334 RepID=UPI002041C84D|nr:hypothetical protein [Neobacillus muris]